MIYMKLWDQPDQTLFSILKTSTLVYSKNFIFIFWAHPNLLATQRHHKIFLGKVKLRPFCRRRGLIDY